MSLQKEIQTQQFQTINNTDAWRSVKYSIKDLGFLWSETVNIRKRSNGELLRIKGIAIARRGKYWKICNEMHNRFSTSDTFLQR